MKILAKKSNGIIYNYWIYVLTCLAVMAIIIKIKGRDPGTQWEIGSIIFSLAKMFFFSTVAWFIGKKYRLHYSLICGLCVLIMVLTIIVWEFYVMLFFHFSFSLELIGVAIGVGLFSTLVVGGTVFTLSFPFQFLYFKLRQNFKKLE